MFYRIIFGNFIPYIILAILSGMLQTITICKLLRHKRFNRNKPILLSSSILNLATFLCLVFMATLINIVTNKNFSLGIISVTILLAFLIYWWQAQITKAYKRSLEQRERESLRSALQESVTAMLKVKEESDRVHHINHRDNGLLTTLDYAVNSILEMDFSDEVAVKERCKELEAEIHRARDRRVTMVYADDIPTTKYETGITLLNLFLNNASKRATDAHVVFSVHISTNLKDFIPKNITDDDLVYLLSDLLDNAFVATRGRNASMIQLQFYKWNKYLVVEIADNGIPFEVDSILQMGIEQRTTHADTGGTGVGLMDIWAMKEKYGATYHLDEYETAAPFTKKISLTFDKKNRYSVRTWRKDEIVSRSKRIDLQVYDHNES